MGLLASLETIGNTANGILKQAEVNGDVLASNFPGLAAAAAGALDFFGFERDARNEKEFDAGNIVKELFQAMNNPVGDVDADFELGFGKNVFANPFDKGI